MTALAGVVGSRSSGFLLDSIVPTGQTFSAYMTTLGLVGAWSPSRKLTNTYSGNIIQLRRSSDSAALYYTSVTGESVNTSQIITDIGSNSAFYAQLYDQSGGGRNLTQATAANQLQAVNAGSIVTINGKICLGGTGSGTIKGQYNFAFSNTCTFIFVCEVGAAQGFIARYISAFANAASDIASTGFSVTDGNTNNNIQTTVLGSTTTALASTSGLVVVRVKKAGATVTIRVNNSVGNTSTGNSTSNFSLQNISLLSADGTSYSNKRMGDVLFFNTAIPDADCVTLERNMGAWYGISVAA